MQHRQLGKCGLKVGAVGIGGWLTFGGSVDDATTDRIIGAALDCGANFIDLADVYAEGRAEEVAGRTLRRHARHQLVVSSKVYGAMSGDPNDRGLSRKHVLESCDRSLQRLGLSYLDLYFCHREDPSVPVEETVAAMDHLVRAGKILYWGTSCWSGERLAQAVEVARDLRMTAPVVEQVPYSLVDRGMEANLQPLAERLGLGITVFSPIAGGVLPGKYGEGVPHGTRGAATPHVAGHLAEARQAQVRRFVQRAAELGHAPSTLAIAWTLHNERVACALTGATHPDHVRQNAAGAHVRLDTATAAGLAAIFA